MYWVSSSVAIGKAVRSYTFQPIVQRLPSPEVTGFLLAALKRRRRIRRMNLRGLRFGYPTGPFQSMSFGTVTGSRRSWSNSSVCFFGSGLWFFRFGLIGFGVFVFGCILLFPFNQCFH